MKGGGGYFKNEIQNYIATLSLDESSAFGYRLISIEEFDNQVEVESVVASTTLDNSEKYAVENIIDDDFSTAWVEGQSSYGKDETITFTFDREYTIVGVLITNGYTKSDSAFINNNRVKNMDILCGNKEETITLDSAFSESMYYTWKGNTLELDVKDYTDFIYFENAYITNEISIRIKDVYAGDLYDDTCISEISFIGF